MLMTLLIAAAAAAPAPALPSRGDLLRREARLAAAGEKPLRYCIPQVDDGHPYCPHVCRTRADWRRHGVDPLDYLGAPARSAKAADHSALPYT